MSDSRAALVAEFFKSQPERWIDGRELANVGGYAGWRTRISDVRRAPFNLHIENRQRRVKASDERCSYVISEY